MKPKRESKTECICVLDINCRSPEALSEYFEKLHEEYCNKYESLEVCFEYGYGNESNGMILEGTRLETDDEYNKRISKVKETKVKEKLSAMEKVLKLMKQNKLTVDDIKNEVKEIN